MQYQNLYATFYHQFAVIIKRQILRTNIWTHRIKIIIGHWKNISFLGKVFEQVVSVQLQFLREETDFLAPFQSSFRAGYGKQTALVTLHWEKERPLSSFQYWQPQCSHKPGDFCDVGILYYSGSAPVWMPVSRRLCCLEVAELWNPVRLYFISYIVLT